MCAFYSIYIINIASLTIVSQLFDCHFASAYAISNESNPFDFCHMLPFISRWIPILKHISDMLFFFIRFFNYSFYSLSDQAVAQPPRLHRKLLHRKSFTQKARVATAMTSQKHPKRFHQDNHLSRCQLNRLSSFHIRSFKLPMLLDLCEYCISFCINLLTSIYLVAFRLTSCNFESFQWVFNRSG